MINLTEFHDDPRFKMFHERLHHLTIEQLERLVSYPKELVCDTYNYDGRFCALAVAFDVPKILQDRELNNEIVRSTIERVASQQIPNFVINPTKGVQGRFYTDNRQEDLIALATEVLNEKRHTTLI